LFLRINGFGLDATNAELEKFALEVASSQHTMAEIVVWLQAHARAIGG
jgi:prophage maintenance system killer protein